MKVTLCRAVKRGLGPGRMAARTRGCRDEKHCRLLKVDVRASWGPGHLEELAQVAHGQHAGGGAGPGPCFLPGRSWLLSLKLLAPARTPG